jgi:hypothetical protein
VSIPGWNGWAVEARCRAGCREHGGAGEAMTPYDTRSGTVLQNLAAGAVVTIPTAAAAMLPASGAAKDKAQGSLAFKYTVGTAASDDTFSFTIDSTTSAVAAKHNFGAGLVPADAVFECELKLRTYAPLAAGPSVRIPMMPTLTSPATETMAATFSFAPGGLSGFRVAGDPELTFPLTLATGQWFDYTLTYSIVTPYGTDPHVSYTLLGGAAGQAPANLVPNPEFEIVGPNGATVVTNTPNVLNPSAAAAWNQALFNGTQLTTSLVPSTDVLAGSCGNMLRIESNGQFTGSNASPISVNLPFEIPVGSRGSLDIRVLAGSVTIAFAINTANATTLDSAVTVSSANGMTPVAAGRSFIPARFPWWGISTAMAGMTSPSAPAGRRRMLMSRFPPAGASLAKLCGMATFALARRYRKSAMSMATARPIWCALCATAGPEAPKRTWRLSSLPDRCSIITESGSGICISRRPPPMSRCWPISMATAAWTSWRCIRTGEYSPLLLPFSIASAPALGARPLRIRTGCGNPASATMPTKPR